MTVDALHDDAALVAEARRLKAAGKSQREIATALGKPRLWLRTNAWAMTGPAIGAALVAVDPQTRLEFHPLADLFPLMEGTEFEEFAADIKANGQREDIVLLAGKVLDGRNRYRACRAAGVAPRIVAFRPEVHGEPLAFVLSKNLKRRHLNESQRAMVAARIANLPAHRPLKQDKSANLPTSQPQAAASMNVSERLVRSAKVVHDKGAPSLISAVDRGKMKVSEAAIAARMSREQQERVAAAAEAGEAKPVRVIIQHDRRAAHAARAVNGGTVDDLHNLVASGFRAGAILADPPWHFVARSERGEGRSANVHYRTDGLDEIKALGEVVRQLAAADCALFMWMVDWAVAPALEVIEAWGCAHKTCAFTWAKLRENAGHDPNAWHMGQGFWTRANPEQCWLATRGAPKRLYADVRQLIIAPVMEHSHKPDEVNARIERLVTGPYLELFARRERDGWLTWGDELPANLTTAA